jgi:hypothetical protein
MKRKANLKTENLKTINPAVLEEILGGAQVAGDDKRTTVIAQVPFGSFFHS